MVKSSAFTPPSAIPSAIARAVPREPSLQRSRVRRERERVRRPENVRTPYHTLSSERRSKMNDSSPDSRCPPRQPCANENLSLTPSFAGERSRRRTRRSPRPAAPSPRRPGLLRVHHPQRVTYPHPRDVGADAHEIALLHAGVRGHLGPSQLEVPPPPHHPLGPGVIPRASTDLDEGGVPRVRHGRQRAVGGSPTADAVVRWRVRGAPRGADVGFGVVVPARRAVVHGDAARRGVGAGEAQEHHRATTSRRLAVSTV